MYRYYRCLSSCDVAQQPERRERSVCCEHEEQLDWFSKPGEPPQPGVSYDTSQRIDHNARGRQRDWRRLPITTTPTDRGGTS